MFGNKLKNRFSGFTLVEVMVSISIFIIIVTIGVGALSTLGDAYKKTQAQKDAIETLGFVLESMAREIKIGSDYSCTSTPNCVAGDSRINFESFGGRGTFAYYDSSGVIYRDADGLIQPMTSSTQLTIDELEFRVSGVGIYGEDPQLQPFVIINIAGTLLATGDTFSIQTAVSQRTLEKDVFLTPVP